MHLNRFDLNLLVALNALLEEKSVTRAAERVHVSQPAMSGALQRLRENFDDQLLVRAGQRMELTPRARDLQQPVREILLQIESHLNADAAFEPQTSHREFSISMTDFVATVVLPNVIRRIEVEAPGITVHVEPLHRDSLPMLATGALDFVVRALVEPHRMQQSQALRSETLFSDDWACVAAKDHPTLGDSISAEEYLELPHVALSFGKDSSTLEEIALRHMGIDIDVRATARTFATVFFVAMETSLIGLLPRRMALRLSRSKPAKVLEMPIDIGQLTESLFWHERNDSDPAHLWLKDIIVSTAKKVFA